MGGHGRRAARIRGWRAGTKHFVTAGNAIME
jgi:hypothetical protein